MPRVLVVDDDPMIVEGLLACFELESIRAIGVSDCASAESLLKSQFFPVVLADLRLRSEGEGLRLLESIRAISPVTRVASMTGYATPQMEAEMQRLGSRLVLHKPVGPDAVIAAVRELLTEIENASAEVAEPDLGTLYESTRRILLSIACRRYGLGASDAEEVLHEAWCLFLEKRHAVTSAKPWLAGTIVNLCRRELTRRGRHVQQDELLEEQLTVSQDDSGLIVDDALAQLDPRARDLIRMISLEERSYDEVARHAGLQVGSIGPLLIRAKQKLRATLSAV
jgi:RNA polymerase sigma factor (sigma-70 family)